MLPLFHSITASAPPQDVIEDGAAATIEASLDIELGITDDRKCGAVPIPEESLRRDFDRILSFNNGDRRVDEEGPEIRGDEDAHMAARSSFSLAFSSFTISGMIFLVRVVLVGST